MDLWNLFKNIILHLVFCSIVRFWYKYLNVLLAWQHCYKWFLIMYCRLECAHTHTHTVVDMRIFQFYFWFLLFFPFVKRFSSFLNHLTIEAWDVKINIVRLTSSNIDIYFRRFFLFSLSFYCWYRVRIIFFKYTDLLVFRVFVLFVFVGIDIDSQCYPEILKWYTHSQNKHLPRIYNENHLNQLFTTCSHFLFCFFIHFFCFSGGFLFSPSSFLF